MKIQYFIYSPLHHFVFFTLLFCSLLVLIHYTPLSSLPNQNSSEKEDHTSASTATSSIPTLHKHLKAYPLPSPVSPSIQGVIIGDTRADAPNLGPSAYWPMFKKAFSIHKPQFLFHLGDWVKRDTLQEWKRVMSTLPPLPVVSVRGNHDRGSSFFKLGFSSPKQVLSRFQLGPLLIYLFDTEGAVKWTRLQLQKDIQAWKNDPLKDIDNLSQIKYRLWLQHRPPYSSGHHGSDERKWNEWLIPVIESLNIDVVLSGHDHHYERFCPQSIKNPQKCAQDGIQYVVSGGGATVTTPWASWLSTQAEINIGTLGTRKPVQMHTFRGRVKASSSSHYLHVIADQKDCLFKVYAVYLEGNQEEIDSFPCRF